MSTEGESETSGCTFLGCDDQPASTGDQCDVWSQDCPDGQKCTAWADDGGSSWNATKCSPVDPNPDLPGEPCTVKGSAVSGVDSCAKGTMCWDVDPDTNEGVCFPFCAGSLKEPICPRGSVCHIHGDGPLILCEPFCDPLLQDCPGDHLCLPAGGYWGCVLDASGEEGQYGDPCEDANACDPGLLCLNPEYVPDCNAGGCCSPFCDTDEANTCPGGGQVCVPFYDEGQAPKGLETIGFCGIPQ